MEWWWLARRYAGGVQLTAAGRAECVVAIACGGEGEEKGIGVEDDASDGTIHHVNSSTSSSSWAWHAAARSSVAALR